MITELKSIVGENRQNLNGILFAGHVDAVVLVADTATAYTVPTGGDFLLISSTVSFYASSLGTAVIPTADVTDGTASELNPVLRAVGAGETISFIADRACVITISVYS